MSPLLGSTGGSSEYAFRGTLDDWPVDFSTTLTGQNLTGQNPNSSLFANLTVTGINYKARVIVESNNATLSIDGGVTYSPAKETDTPIFVRDNAAIRIRLQTTFGTVGDFSKTYIVPVKIGKRTSNWIVSTRPIDDAPNTFTFTPLLDQELGVTTTSNTITISGLEPGFSFPINVSAQDGLGNFEFYKNGSGPLTSGTVVNGDQIYLSALTSSTYSTTRSFTIQIGTVSGSWGFKTRSADTALNSFNFTGISSATSLGTNYISNQITVSGADPGIGLTTIISGPNAFYEIRTSDPGNPLRYTDPAFPISPPPEYYQNGISTAFDGDKITVRMPASSNYSTTTVGILTVSNQSASYIITTRPAPIDTIPTGFIFNDLLGLGQPRNFTVTSDPITLSAMFTGQFGTASITNSTAGITPQFQVTRGGTVVKAYTTSGSFPVTNSDIINLRMITPNISGSNGVSNSFITFGVSGTDTTVNLNPIEGYQISNQTITDSWNVTTIARTCSITPFTINSLANVQINTNNDVIFTPTGFNTDCQMVATVTSNSSSYNFIAVNGVSITPTQSLNIDPGIPLTLRVRSSGNYLSTVTSSVTVSNSSTGITPTVGFTTSFTVSTTGDNTPVSISLNSNLSTVEIGKPFTLTWSTINVTSIRSVSGTNWTTVSGASTLPLNGSVTLNAPGSNTIYTITGYGNTYASNYNSLSGPADGTPPTKYETATASIAVTQDVTPILTPPDFTDQFGVTRSSVPFSNIITISDITSPLSGIVTGSPGASFYFFGQSGIQPQIDSAIVSGTELQLKVNASSQYDTTTTAWMTLIDPSTPTIERSKVNFSVTTEVCVPSTTTSSIPSSISPLPTNYATIKYYSGNTQFNTSPTNIVLGETLLYGDGVSGTITASAGSATGYYNSLSPSAGIFQDLSTLTWAKLVDVYYYAFTSELQRPPTLTEMDTFIITSALTYAPSNYSNATSLYNAIRNIIASPTYSIGPGMRDTNYPIYNNCPINSSTSTINQSGYSSVIV